MYYINKIALWIANPMTLGVLLVLLGFGLKWFGMRGAERRGLVLAVVWLLVWSMPATGRLVGWTAGLDEYGLTRVEDLPTADAIVDLGGGMGGGPEYPYADMSPGGDRAWHAARLYKAGKAPIVITSGKWTAITDKPLIVDLGVPADAILVEDQSRNTEENARFVDRLFGREPRPRILLVTSIYHMKRSMMIFRKCAPKLECIAAGTDYGSYDPDAPWRWDDFCPSAGAFAGNMVLFKEWLGIIGYRLRGF